MLVLSVSFSPARAELLHDVKDDLVGNGDQPTMSMVSALVMAIKAFKKNVTKEIAEMSGGEYTTFTGDKRFEQRVVDAAKHMRNRYLITFSPSTRLRACTQFGCGPPRTTARGLWRGPITGLRAQP